MMADDKENPESGAGKAKPPKIKAEDNPWYLLATLYGVPKSWNDEIKAKNRVAWNRYFAANLDERTRTKLIEENRHLAEELTPFSPDVLREIEAAFAERCKAAAKKPELPASNANIDFSNVNFEQVVFFGGYFYSFLKVTFDGATFSRDAHFGGATFSGVATFEGVIFSGWANFHETFFAWAYFGGATFSGDATFSGATFSADMADFGRATFSDVYFHGATFFAGADFGGATFSGRAHFISDVTFSGRANFDSATFWAWADFDGAKFQTSSSFVNVEMKDTTSFKGAIFKTEPPKFFGAKLHQGTVWRGITWPPFPKNKDEAGAFLDAYACLKLEMDRLKKHDDELDFFALELQSRCVLLGPWRGLPILLYGVLSDYGRSYARPFLWLLIVAAIGAVLLVFSDALPIEKSFGLSFANTLNVFGFRKDFFDSHYVEDLPAALKILAAIQTILGGILLFLFGLGIRNKFRMK
jgi:uncharacterized protein YjbI with pentapeptide repeats